MNKQDAAEKFLAQVYAAEPNAAGIDLVCNKLVHLMDGLFEEHFDSTMQDAYFFGVKAGDPDFTSIDSILKLADPWKMSNSVSLSFLTITLGGKNNLEEREAFIERFKTRLLETKSKKRVKNMLDKLI